VGVRTPRVYLLDRTLAVYPAEIALVEDVRGGTLEQWHTGRCANTGSTRSGCGSTASRCTCR
jgi:hypothetical protein